MPVVPWPGTAQCDWGGAEKVVLVPAIHPDGIQRDPLPEIRMMQGNDDGPHGDVVPGRFENEGSGREIGMVRGDRLPRIAAARVEAHVSRAAADGLSPELAATNATPIDPRPSKSRSSSRSTGSESAGVKGADVALLGAVRSIAENVERLREDDFARFPVAVRCCTCCCRRYHSALPWRQSFPD